MDLDTYCAKGCYFIGTSGSTLDDMLSLKDKVESSQLDTNVLVAAISGLEGAIEGIRAVEKQLIPGKILAYPACKGLGVTPLPSLGKRVVDEARRAGPPRRLRQKLTPAPHHRGKTFPKIGKAHLSFSKHWESPVVPVPVLGNSYHKPCCFQALLPAGSL